MHAYVRTSWASQKADKAPCYESKLVNHCKFGLEIRKNWPWLNSSYAGPTRTRRDIQENSKLPFFGDIFGLQMCVTALKIILPDEGEKWCRQFWRHKETIDSSYTAQFVTITRYYQKRFLYIEQVVMRTSGIAAMSRSVLRVSIWNFQLVFEPHVQRDWVSALLFVFLQVLVTFVFSRIVGSIASLGKENI